MGAWDDHERAALVALLRTRPEGLTWPQITAKVADRGSATEVWEQYQPPTLFENTGDAQDDAGALKAALSDVEAWRTAEFTFLTFQDNDYPAQLREVHQMPPILFARGTLNPGEKAVSVVGSRKASNQAIDTATTIAKTLAGMQITVLSGLAEGIDTAAHTAALSVAGRTVAVIGTGINKFFPATNRALQEKIASSGLVLSQFWPDTPPTKLTFPMRNATMSAYGRATIIVEAGEQSGARIQARSAVAHGRPVILLDSVVRGTNWGRKLRGEPGVFIASNAEEATQHVKQIIFGENQISKLLAMVGEC